MSQDIRESYYLCYRFLNLVFFFMYNYNKLTLKYRLVLINLNILLSFIISVKDGNFVSYFVNFLSIYYFYPYYQLVSTQNKKARIAYECIIITNGDSLPEYLSQISLIFLRFSLKLATYLFTDVIYQSVVRSFAIYIVICY